MRFGLPLAQQLVLLGALVAAASPALDGKQTCDCLADPTAMCCMSYQVSDDDAAADLATNCAAMPWMFGCGVSKACDAGLVTGTVCAPFALLADTCLDMPGMGGCSDYNALCGPEGTMVPQCSSQVPLNNTLTTMTARANIGNVCTTMPGMEGCDQCTDPSSQACACGQLANMGSSCQVSTTSSYLEVLSLLCLAMPGMSGCANFNTLCQFESSALGSFCGSGGMDMDMDTDADTDTEPAVACDCISDPTQMCCMSWQYPDADATASLDVNCNAMHWMFGCGVSEACAASEVTGTVCAPFALLADTCLDMPGMGGCSDYNALCGPEGTMVPQCSSQAPLDNGLTTATARADIGALCTLMPGMEGCDQCARVSSGEACACGLLSDTSSTCQVSQDSSYLTVLSVLCKAMPGMERCANFLQMCASSGSALGDLCPEGAAAGDGSSSSSSALCNGYATTMYMSGLKLSIKPTDPCLVFLHEDAILDTEAKLACAVVGTFLLGLCSGFLGMLFKAYYANLAKGTTPKDPLQRVGAALQRMLVPVLQVLVGYVLMLLAMTYYVWFLVAAVLGLGVGAAIFPSPSTSVAICHEGVSA